MADVLCVQVNHRGGLRLSVESDQVRVQTQWSKCIIPNPGTCILVRIINIQLSHSVIRAFFSFRHHRLPTATGPNPNPATRLNSQPNPISNHQRFGLGAFPANDDGDDSRSRKGSQSMVQRAPLHPRLPQVSLQPRRIDDDDCMYVSLYNIHLISFNLLYPPSTSPPLPSPSFLFPHILTLYTPLIHSFFNLHI